MLEGWVVALVVSAVATPVAVASWASARHATDAVGRGAKVPLRAARQRDARAPAAGDGHDRQHGRRAA